MPQDCFIFTSNVDGQFQQAGFSWDRIHECHGSLHYLQGLYGGPTISADAVDLPEVDPATLRVAGDALPRMPDGALARPNVLMFGDWGFDDSREDGQRRRLA